MQRQLDHSQVIIELISIGNAMKVSAMDPESLTEVSIVGDARTSRDILERTAVRKLEYVMRKNGLIA